MYNAQDHCEVVKEVQRYLLAIQYRQGLVPTITVDGFYTDAVRDSVASFQEQNNLAVTGYVDEKTWELLFLGYEQSLIEDVTFDLLPPNTFDIKIGDIGHAVILLQSMLIELAKVYPAIPRPAITGQFGLGTADAVRGIQRTYGLYESGEVSPSLWARMLRDYEGKKSVYPIVSDQI